MPYVSNVQGIAAFVCLGAVAALHIAPTMERQLRADASRLLEPFQYDLVAQVDGRQVRVSGMVPSNETRFAVLRQLQALHPLARVVADIRLIEQPRFQEFNEGAANGL